MRNEIFHHIHPGEELVREPFQRLIEKQALLAYKYTGFWQCMDTFKDKQRLEELNQGTAPWKVWNHAGSPATIRRRGDLSSRMIHLNLERTNGGAADRSYAWARIPTTSKLAVAARFSGWPKQYPDCSVSLGGVQRDRGAGSRSATRGRIVRRPTSERPAAEDFPGRLHALRRRRGESSFRKGTEGSSPQT